MDMKEQANKNAAVAKQAASSPSGCKACERKGVPIMPLRVAVMLDHTVRTDWHPAVPAQDVELTSGEFKYGLRTLRMGYLYVLLDNSIWEGYEVTAEGYLRYFNVNEMPEGGSVASLSSGCLKQNHDIKCSFLHIDNARDRTVLLAFSSDAWSKEVLKGYKNGDRPANRFTKLSVTKEGKVSVIKDGKTIADGALVIDHSLSVLTNNVAEYATEFFPDTAKVNGNITGGAHGFHSRKAPGKLRALSNYVNQLTDQYRCVVAVPVDDAVGVVQELNIGRLMLLEAANEYMARPGVFHKHMISEAIMWYLGEIKKDIAAKSQPGFKVSGPVIGGYGPTPVSAEQAAEDTFARQYARLLESYDEPARATFAQNFASYFSTPMERLAAIDTDLAAWYQSPLWNSVIKEDYDPATCPSGWAWQMLTVAACVQGGAMGEATDKIWEGWMKTSTSPAYLGFTGTQTSLMGTLFSGGNVYGYLKTAATSDEFASILKDKAVKKGFASRLIALSGSFSRPGMKVDAATRKSYMAMTQGAMLTAGEPMVVMSWQTTLRKLKRRLQYDATLRQALSRNNATYEILSEQLQLKETARGGGALMVDQLMGIHGKTLDTPVRVEFSVPGEIKDIVDEQPEIAKKAASSGNLQLLDELDDVYISDMSLQGKGQTTPLFKASYAEIAQWNERTMRIFSGDGVGLVLGAGLIALQVANMQSLKDDLRRSVGTDVDAVTNIAIATLLFIEGMSEVSGFASKLAVKLNWVVLSKAQQVPALVRFGGVLGGIASVLDGVRNGIHGWEAINAGDTAASITYYISGGAFISGGVIAGYWSKNGVFALTRSGASGFLTLGPVGWATLLILTGMMLAYVANELRSKAFEIWLRRTCFGIPNGAINAMPVWHADSLEDLGEALIEFWAIAGGMVADVAFASGFDFLTGNPTVNNVNYRRVDFRVSMPGWVEGSGGWLIQLSGAGKILFSESDNAPGTDNHCQTSGPHGLYKHEWRKDGIAGEDGREQAPWSLSLSVSIWVPIHSTPEVTLKVSYWPDSQNAGTKMGMALNATQG
ncbi:T6SS effector BTH_I2691 family protein [Enterobacter kobei]|uniref:T6SS effector BTH_I2691 family protein n=1 Tax=Enterobacter kobei TaxID=208224 RepID=UPI002FD40C69